MAIHAAAHAVTVRTERPAAITAAPLSSSELLRVLAAIDGLRAGVGLPGDYGKRSRLGRALKEIYDIGAELRGVEAVELV